MSLIKPIPKKLRDEMSADPFYAKCCITGAFWSQIVKIEWHHNFESYANGNKGRVNEKWCILPITEEVHRNLSNHKTKLDWIMLNRATDDELHYWSKSENLLAKRYRLNKIYGEPRP